MDNLDLFSAKIESLGSLTSVEGYLDLENSELQSLGDLTSVGGYLNMEYSKIKDLGNLTSVGGYLYLGKTPLSRKYTEEKIRSIVEVKHKIYF